MGDRALVVFTDGKDVSPTTYLHWSGDAVPELLKEHHAVMQGRLGDVSYATARFIGICHTHIEGNLSLGCWNTSAEHRAAIIDRNKAKLADYSHGDAGVIVVDCNTGKWSAYGGYLERHVEAENDSIKASRK
jgi:hypothetical protein